MSSRAQVKQEQGPKPMKREQEPFTGNCILMHLLLFPSIQPPFQPFTHPPPLSVPCPTPLPRGEE